MNFSIALARASLEKDRQRREAAYMLAYKLNKEIADKIEQLARNICIVRQENKMNHLRKEIEDIIIAASSDMHTSHSIDEIKHRCKHKLLDDIYSIQAINFVLLVYDTYNIENIYNHWKNFSDPCLQMEKIVNQIFANGDWKSNIHIMYGSCSSSPTTHRNKCMKKTNILTKRQMFTINGYIRNIQNNNRCYTYIPMCIKQVISVYYAISLH
eukprot:224650_1